VEAVVRVCYIVGPKDPGDQLRYSLRSLRNLDHDGVTIAGYIPQWVTNVETIPVRQTRTKHANVRAAIKEVCARYDRWVLHWDDVFTTRPTKLEPANRGTVRSLVDSFRQRGPLNSYILDIEKTGKVLERQGFEDPLAFDCIHIPQIIESEHMIRAIEVAEKHRVNAVLTLHGNIAGYGGPEIENAKKETGWQNRTFVSTSDRRWPTAVGDYIRSLFPDPCQYER